jgi:hypothetical protein
MTGCSCGHRSSDHTGDGRLGDANCDRCNCRDYQAIYQGRLTIVPITVRRAASFVSEHHRHHFPPQGSKFALGVADEAGQLCGVIMVGRPVARHLDDGLTAEVNRSATDGTANANSALYGAAWRVCQAMGYRKLITYTQEGESGASLRGAGWQMVRVLPPRKGWAESSVALKAIRDPIGSGGVQRMLWEVTA